MPGLEELNAEACFGQRCVKPLRQRACLQTDPLQRQPQLAKPGDQCVWLAQDLRFAHNLAIAVDHADTRVFQ